MHEFEVGKLYTNARGFIYEVIKNDPVEDTDIRELALKCWNPNDPREYDQIFYVLDGGPIARELYEVDSETLEDSIRYNKGSVKYHMTEAQQRRKASSRFEMELRRRNGI